MFESSSLVSPESPESPPSREGAPEAPTTPQPKPKPAMPIPSILDVSEAEINAIDPMYYSEEETIGEPFYHTNWPLSLQSSLVAFAASSLSCLAVVAILICINEYSDLDSSYWYDQRYQTNSGCEAVREEKWLAQPVNALTNIFFVLVGIWMIICGCADYFKNTAGGRHNVNLFILYPETSVIYGCNSIILGATSFAWHASFQRAGAKADVGAMYYFLVVFIAGLLIRSLPIHVNLKHLRTIAAAMLFVASVGGGIMWENKNKFDGNLTMVIAMFIAVIVVVAVIPVLLPILGCDVYKSTNRSPFWLAASGIAMGGSYVTRQHANDMCFESGSSFYQAHGVWHWGSAVAIWCVYLYARSECYLLMLEEEDERHPVQIEIRAHRRSLRAYSRSMSVSMSRPDGRPDVDAILKLHDSTLAARTNDPREASASRRASQLLIPDAVTEERKEVVGADGGHVNNAGDTDLV